MAQPKMDTQPASKRICNFSEVALGYSKRIAQEEAKRCPQCADPVCKKGCPLGINIPGFIRLIREGNMAQALSIIKQDNPLPAVCGRICAAPCEVACVLTEEGASIGIRALERFASDAAPAKTDVKKNALKGSAHKVAVVGSGPAGLAAAEQLARQGIYVKIFEAADRPGGVLRYGIPEFRLPAKILDAQIASITALGVEVECNALIGRTKSMDELMGEGFSAVVLALGAGAPKFMDLPGAHFGGVYYGEEFLIRLNLTRLSFGAKVRPSFFVGNRVAVIGSGNTALDCARAARRLGANVKLIFRRTEEEMRVREDVLQFAKEEGIELEAFTRPLHLKAGQDNFVCGIQCVKMDYGSDGDMKWKLIPVPGSEYTMDADTVVIAIGHNPNSSFAEIHQQLKSRADGTLSADEKNAMTPLRGVFAAGNVTTNAGPVVEAIASGKRVAKSVLEYINGA